ncbi:SLC13 family permease [Umboniibacter marinipuniceus]|uniref:Di/tricarboxylate transporter n=1 Tax=Umboniibacter marinipuniceus TaxID=569599 RepID=A0A3M0A419_9GAMM|nr:SLC13 family permease [Umboniibacter marinipuniceus]RMA79530.1 di/tricarboxylate transporter [Umboniibacter marinipuniceus]
MDASTQLVLIISLLLLGLLIQQRRASAFFAVAALACYALDMVDTNELLSVLTNQGVVTLVLLLVASFALERTQLVYSMSRKLFSKKPKHARASTLTMAGLLSSVLSNTAVVAALITPIKRNGKVAPSKLLIPLSYISIAGGTLTLVGTSTNLIINAQMVESGMASLGFFDFTLVGLGALAAVAFAVSVCHYILPTRWPKDNDEEHYFVEAMVSDDSPLVNKSVEENGLRTLENFFLAEIVRDGRLISPVRPFHHIRAGDKLLFSGQVSKLDSLAIIEGIEIFAHREGYPTDNLVEVLIKPGSVLVGKNLQNMRFRSRFDAAVVAIRRQGETLSGKLGDIKLRAGDFLTLATGPDFNTRPNLARNFFVLSDLTTDRVITGWRQILTLGGFIGALSTSIIMGIPLLKPLIFYVAAMLITKTLLTNDIKQRFPYELVGIVLGALIIALAFLNTGLSASIASAAQTALAGQALWITLIGVYLLTLITTELITNNAAAAMVFPIALGIAEGLGVSPMPFIMATAFAASGSFISPFGYQTNLMVFNAGQYKLKHFLMCGVPTSICYGVAVLCLIPVVFPF